MFSSVFGLLCLVVIAGCSRGRPADEVFQEARSNLATGHLNAAIAGFTEIIEKDPNSYASYVNRATAERELEQYAKAISDCNRAIEINSNACDAFIERGLSEVGEGSREQAIADYVHLHAPQLKPTNSYAFYEMGVLDCELSNYNEAIVALTHGIQLGDDLSLGYCYRGIARAKAADPDGAISDYDEAIKIEPTNSVYYYDRGWTEFQKGDFDSSITDATRSIQLDPTNSIYYRKRAWTEFLKGDFGSSITDATRSIQLDPNDGHAYGTRGWARYKTGDVSGAVEDCNRATQLLKPGSASFFYDHGMLNFIGKEYEQAIADWQNAIGQDPNLKKELSPWIEKAHDKLKR
jgi:tetratricopeptide (TPR) repeat protein